MYKEASLFKRFGAFLIDNIILIFLLYFVILLMVPMFGLSSTEVPQALVDFTNSPEFSTAGLVELLNTNPEVAKFFDSMTPFFGVLLITFMIVYIVYFVVIPSFFRNFQTIGRYVTKLNIVDNEGYLVGFKENSLRLLGDFLVLILNSFLMIGYTINIFMLMTRNRTLGDIFAKTKLVDLSKKAEIIIINPDGTFTKKEVEESDFKVVENPSDNKEDRD